MEKKTLKTIQTTDEIRLKLKNKEEEPPSLEQYSSRAI